MRFHHHSLNIAELLHGNAAVTPRRLGLTLPGDWQCWQCAGQQQTAGESARLTWGIGLMAPLAAHAAVSEHLSVTTAARLALLKSICAAAVPVHVIKLPGMPKLENVPCSEYSIPYNDVWLRDTAPLFLVPRARTTQQPAIGAAVVFRFNAWGERYPHNADSRLAVELVMKLRQRGAFAAYNDFYLFTTDLCLEGGALESNGCGTLLSTAGVCLNANRCNDHADGKPLNAAEFQRVLTELLGADRLILLDAGLPDDDTDGHIDNIARFISADSILLAEPAPGETSDLIAMFAAAAAKLQAAGFHVERCPLPPRRLHPQTGKRLAASYLNYLRLPGRLVLPSYQQRSEQALLLQLSQWFPGQCVDWVDWRAAILEGGGPHCVTTAIPLLSSATAGASAGAAI